MGSLATVTPKLAKLIPLLGSDQPGEVVAAATAIQGLLKKAGCDFHDLVAVIESPPPAARPRTDFHEPEKAEIHVMADFCYQRRDLVDEKHRPFIEKMHRYALNGWYITGNQANYLAGIYRRLRKYGE
jgi:hypothetical protein